MKKETYNSDLENEMEGIGIWVESEALNKEDLLENHKTLIRAIKLLLVTENINSDKLEQAMDLAQGMR